jgi:hypothetical protein
MLMRRAHLLGPLLLLAVVACGDGNPSEATPTATSTTAASAAATADRSVGSLREVDFGDLSLLGPLIDAAGGGEVPLERIEFHDLVGNDGVEEAVVIVESGGTLGDLGAGVFALIDGAPELVQFVATAGRVEVRLDLIVAIEGVWAPADPQCCPSQLRETSYQWDGARFIAITEQVVAAPGE